MNDLPDKAAPTRVFLSYARGDDEPFVGRLHADLTQAGFTVWFDRESLMSRGLSFHQEIKDAIRTEVDRVIYVGGPKAAMSPYVREEWQFALECDHVVVTPILRLGDYEHVPGELSLLHCEDFRDDAKYGAALAKLVASLRQPNPRLGALFAVPSLPPNFLSRPELMRRVRDALLVDLQKPQVITSADARVGMQGMGGIGKSVLAAALARNRQVRQSYPDGIVWISCGQHLAPNDLLQRQRDLARHLGGDTHFDSLPQGQGVLRELLAAKAVLLVLDDVWQAADAQAFDVLGPRCRMLVTTRDAGILHALHGELVPVSLFTENEALQCLADAVGVGRAALPPEARAVVAECGCLPLAVALSGGMAKKRGGDFHSLLERLRRADLDKIADRESINEQHRSIWRAMQVSVDVLAEEEQRRFAELVVFATDRPVPAAAAATLWAQTGNLADLDTEDLLINLAERSLVQLEQKPDAGGNPQRRFRLHDLLHDYAVRIAGEPATLHRKLIDAYRKKCPDGWHTGPNDGYFFENLVHHFVHTQAWPEAETLVTDFSWLMRKCELGLLDSLARDFGLMSELAPAETKKRLDIWQAFFRERTHVLRRGNAEWPAHKILLQLAVEHADDSPLALAAERWLADGRCDWLWLRRNRRLPHACINACLAVLAGHTVSVEGALAVADGRLLSWSGCWEDQWGHGRRDNTLRLWDGQSGACLAVLEGHTDSVNGALELTDGRLLSWSDDNTLRLWDGQSGACLAVLRGHTSSVRGALALADGRLLSWSHDKTLRLWDGRGEKCLATLEGHAESIHDALVLVDGRLLSWSKDKTMRIWDGQSGKCSAVLGGHTDGVFGALVLADGRLLSWGGRTLRLWDGQRGALLAVLEGHTHWIHGALALADGRLLSWSDDKILRLWDGQSGACLAVLEGHTQGVCGALVSADGRLLSWGGGTLRLWDGQSGALLAVLEGHTHWIHGALALADGRLLSWSEDKTLRLWDGQSGECLAVLKGHSKGVLGVLALADGRLLSWSDDHDLRIWNSQSDVCPAVLEGHTRGIPCALALADGRLLSWTVESEDNTLRLWDSENGACLETVTEDQATKRHPEWPHSRPFINSKSVCRGFSMDCFAGPPCLSAHLRHEAIPSIRWTCYAEAAARAGRVLPDVVYPDDTRRILSAWNADSEAQARCLLPDGTAVVTQDNGQVCILKLHHGNRRISLAEAEALLPGLHPQT